MHSPDNSGMTGGTPLHWAVARGGAGQVRIITMLEMFFAALAFNQDLSGWCVSNISSSPTNFDTDATAWTNAAHRPVWGTCP